MACLTICILEYQALSIHLRSLTVTLGSALGHARDSLRRLVDQVAVAVGQIMVIDEYVASIDVAELQLKRDEVEAQLAGTEDQRLHEQLQRALEQRTDEIVAIEQTREDVRSLRTDPL